MSCHLCVADVVSLMSCHWCRDTDVMSLMCVRVSCRSGVWLADVEAPVYVREQRDASRASWPITECLRTHPGDRPRQQMWGEIICCALATLTVVLSPLSRWCHRHRRGGATVEAVPWPLSRQCCGCQRHHWGGVIATIQMAPASPSRWCHWGGAVATVEAVASQPSSRCHSLRQDWYVNCVEFQLIYVYCSLWVSVNNIFKSSFPSTTALPAFLPPSVQPNYCLLMTCYQQQVKIS